MVEKATDNKLYFLSITLLCILTYLLNCCTLIYQCALAFIIIAITMNATTSVYGKSKALRGLAFAIAISFVLLWELPYYIDGKMINGIVVASFTSLMISMYWSVFVFQKLRSKFSAMASNALSFAAGTIIDGLIMGLFFIANNNFSYEKILDIFMKECSYKLTYGLVASVILAIALNMLKKNPNLKVKMAMEKFYVTAK